jgi:VWFA-related protein
MHRSLRLASAAFVLLPTFLLAQDKPVLVKPADKPATTITAESRLVNLPVIVRDNKGALVQNLIKADFSLQVDGKPQVIRYFDLDKDLPLTLGLLVDTSESLRNSLDDERSASSAFLDQMLTGKQDQAFVIEFARSVELLQELTNSRAKLQAGLKELDTQTASASDTDTTGDSAPDKNGRTHRARGGTTLYDAVFLASDEIMSKQKGRKALIVLTDGVDRGSKERLTDAIEAAQRADTIVYAVYFKGEAPQHDSYNDSNRGGYPRGGGYPGGGYPGGGYPGGGYPGGGGGRRGGGPSNEPDQRADGKKTLERIAHETGGRLFEVSRKQPVSDIYAEIGKELRAQYRLGYTPDKDASEDGYHRIDLALTDSNKKKFTVQTRDGYYTGK